MGNELGNNNKYKRILHWITSAIGTFLYVFFMMATMILFTSDMQYAYWFLPIFVVPSCLVCLTFASDYWVDRDPVRLRSYWISGIIGTIVLVPASVDYMLCYGRSTPTGFIATFVLPLAPIIYGIWKDCVSRAVKQAGNTKPQNKRFQVNVKNLIRVLCLISICCVALESWQKVIMILYHYTKNLPDYLTIDVCAPFVLAILSAILLARFAKAEFVPRYAPNDEGAL
jgi:hypothetical protein